MLCFPGTKSDAMLQAWRDMLQALAVLSVGLKCLMLLAMCLQVELGDAPDGAGQAGAALPAGIVCQESADGTQANTAAL